MKKKVKKRKIKAIAKFFALQANARERVKFIATYEVSKLYTKLPYDKLKSKKGKQTKGKLAFSTMSLRAAVNHLLKNCYINTGNVIMTQSIDISMGIDPQTFCFNFSTLL